MSDTALATHDATGPHTALTEDSSDASRYDGSRTPPDLQYEIMRRHKQDMSMAAISRDVGCDPRTVKAVIQNWGTAQHTLRLQAHRSQVVDSLILGMHSAAEKGKLDSILSLSDRLGITEAPKNASQTSVGVQVILNGGAAPSELSRAKVTETSETLGEQAQSGSGLISPVMSLQDTPQHAVAQALTDSQLTITQVSVDAQPAQPSADAVVVANVEKQA